MFVKLIAGIHTPHEQPEYKVASQSLPPIRVWKDKNPIGYARLTHARALLLDISNELKIPQENLVTPELVRKLCWQDPPINTEQHLEYVEKSLAQMGARSWRIEQIKNKLAFALGQTDPLIIAEPVESDLELEQPI